jgi:hypothetical protein
MAKIVITIDSVGIKTNLDLRVTAIECASDTSVLALFLPLSRLMTEMENEIAKIETTEKITIGQVMQAMATAKNQKEG